MDNTADTAAHNALQEKCAALEADIHGGLGVKILAHMLGAYFRKVGAVNFATVDITDQSIPDDPLCMSVTIQREGGTSAADKIGTLETKCRALQAEVRAARAIDTHIADYQCSIAEICERCEQTASALSQARKHTDEVGALQ